VPEGESIESITVKWNDGTEVYISQPDTNQYLEVDKSKQYDSNNLGEQLEEEIKIMPIIILVILASLFMYKLVLDSKRI
jgi:hypothetical protein